MGLTMVQRKGSQQTICDHMRLRFDVGVDAWQARPGVRIARTQVTSLSDCLGSLALTARPTGFWLFTAAPPHLLDRTGETVVGL